MQLFDPWEAWISRAMRDHGLPFYLARHLEDLSGPEDATDHQQSSFNEENSMQEYIGDGVYIEFDGFGIWLRANSPDNPEGVYLEPEVLANLNRFAERAFNPKEGN